MSLRKLREKIDRIDFELLSLLNERMELALRTMHLKPAARDPEREKVIISRVTSYAAGLSLLTADFVERLWRGIIEESRRLQVVAPEERKEAGRKHPIQQRSGR